MVILTIEDYWAVAKDVLTDRQYRVLELRERQCHSWRNIGYIIGLDPSTVRGHHQAAVRRLSDHYEGTGT